MRPIQSEREPPSPCEVSALYDSGRFKVMVAMDSETYTVRALMRGEPEARVSSASAIGSRLP